MGEGQEGKMSPKEELVKALVHVRQSCQVSKHRLGPCRQTRYFSNGVGHFRSIFRDGHLFRVPWNIKK